MGLIADSCSPANALSIGTPDFSRVYICRENSITSSSVTRTGTSFAHQLSASPSPRAGAARMSTGVTPVLSSWSATAPWSAASIVPVTSSPRTPRPR
jgi:hypothetical protein